MRKLRIIAIFVTPEVDCYQLTSLERFLLAFSQLLQFLLSAVFEFDMLSVCMRSILVTFTCISDADKLFEHDLGVLNRRVERAGLLSNLGPYCKALCARRDFAIRRQLIKNDKVVIRAALILQLFVSVMLILSVFRLILLIMQVVLLQGLTKQYSTTPVVDNDLLQMSMRLFRTTMAGQSSGPERPDGDAAAAAAAADVSALGGNKLSTVQPEVCVS